MATIADTPASQDIQGSYLGRDPQTARHFSVIQNWLYECCKHSRCRESTSGTEQLNPTDALLPTRCIEVTKKGALLKDTAGQHGPYITLSHRWDPSSELYKTTMDNFQDRINGRALGDLSPNFEDAIEATRRLGLRYLWIDSLCIIQNGDGGSDWAVEARKMSQYYQNSMLTIGAMHSGDKTGFLSPRKEAPFDALVRLPYRDKDGLLSGSFYVYESKSVDQHQRSVCKGELLTRGWVFQEYLLSRRIVLFTPTQIFFDCQSEPPRSECMDMVFSPKLQPAQDEVLGWKMNMHIASVDCAEDKWYSMVEAYCLLKLTKPGKDRLVALSGLAKEFQAKFAAQDNVRDPKPLGYLAGLWLRDIHFGLLWEHRTLPDKRAEVPLASTSSWSWAGVMTGVSWPKRGRHVQNVLSIVGARLADGTHYTMKAETSTRNGHPTSDNMTLDDMSLALIVSGRLHPVWVGKCLDKDGCEEAADVTGYRQRSERKPKSFPPFRAVRSMSSPGFVCGWAVCDAPHIQEQLDTYELTTVIALHVSTESGLSGGVGFGYLSLWHKVSHVLFLEQAGERQYRRIGVGRLFDRNIIEAFDRSPLEEIELI